METCELLVAARCFAMTPKEDVEHDNWDAHCYECTLNSTTRSGVGLMVQVSLSAAGDESHGVKCLVLRITHADELTMRRLRRYESSTHAKGEPFPSAAFEVDDDRPSAPPKLRRPEGGVTGKACAVVNPKSAVRAAVNSFGKQQETFSKQGEASLDGNIMSKLDPEEDKDMFEILDAHVHV